MIRLSEHFTLKKLLRFVLPSIAMMIFTSIYGVVDGLFIKRSVGTTAFSAVNFIMPFLMALGAIGFMIGAGGSAIVSQTMGEGKPDKAKQYFTFLVITTAVSGVIIAIIGEVFIEKVAYLLGARGENAHLLPDSVTYGRIILIALPFFMLQNVFQMFFTTAEKPLLGFSVTVIAGVSNIIIDFLFIVIFKWGVVGAASATALSQFIGGVIPIFYFARNNSSALRFTSTRFNGKVLWKTCTNGCSELMTNISSSIVSMLYNAQLLKLAGENGVAAYGVLMYVSFIFVAVFLGYSIGIAPIVGFNYGSKNSSELKSVLKKSLLFALFTGIAMTAISELLSLPIAKLFADGDASLEKLTVMGFRIYSINFLMCGFNIFGSAFFTALGNGVISAIISFLRTLVFQVITVLILPIFMGVNGVWFSIVIAEILSLMITVAFLISKRKKYNYA